MTVNEYKIRYETILKLELPTVERKQMLAGLLLDMERASEMTIFEDKELEQESKEMSDLYREVFFNFLT